MTPARTLLRTTPLGFLRRKLTIEKWFGRIVLGSCHSGVSSFPNFSSPQTENTRTRTLHGFPLRFIEHLKGKNKEVRMSEVS